jgi:hypothetical protein
MRPLPFPLLSIRARRALALPFTVRDPHLPLPWNLDLARSFSDSQDVRMTPVPSMSDLRFPRRPPPSGLRKGSDSVGPFYFYSSG